MEGVEGKEGNGIEMADEVETVLDRIAAGERCPPKGRARAARPFDNRRDDGHLFPCDAGNAE